MDVEDKKYRINSATVMKVISASACSVRYRPIVRFKILTYYHESTRVIASRLNSSPNNY